MLGILLRFFPNSEPKRLDYYGLAFVNSPV